METVRNVGRRSWQHLMHDSLYRNAVYLMLSTGFMAVCGFVFWIITARLFTTEQVGLATTALSAASLVSNLSLFGFDSAIIRFLPTAKDKQKLISEILLLLAATTGFLSLVLMLLIPLALPELHFLQDTPLAVLLTILLIIGLSLNTAIENILTAYKTSHLVLVKNIILSIVKLGLPLAVVGLGTYGIFLASSGAVLIGLLYGFRTVASKHGFRFAPKRQLDTVPVMRRFALANYVANSNANISAFVVPLIILAALGSSASAYYYLVMMIATMVFVLPLSVGLSMLAEGSYKDADLRQLLRPALKKLFLMLLPVMAVVIAGNQLLLSVFGSEYAQNGGTLLILLVLSAPFVAINYMGNAVLNIRHKLRLLLGLNTLNIALVVGLSAALAPHGLTGVGVAWLIGQIVPAIGHAIHMHRLRS